MAPWCHFTGALKIRGDRDKLRRFLVNLVDNAIKYNGEDGEIRIEASEKAGMIAISVFNTGAGVPPLMRWKWINAG